MIPAIPDVRSLAIYGLAAALLITMATAGVQTMRVAGLRASLAAEKQERAEERAAAEKAAREAENAAREAERRHAAQQQEIVSAYARDRAASALALDSARRDADSLRDAVTCYAAGDCAGANAPASAGGDCRDRARTLGHLFRDADRLAEKLAQDAERRNAEVRALKSQVEADRNACGAANAGIQN